MCLLKRYTILAWLLVLALALSSHMLFALASLAEGGGESERIVAVISLPLDYVPKHVIVGCNGSCVAVVYGVDCFEGFDLYSLNNNNNSIEWVGGIRAKLPWHRVFVGSNDIYVLRYWVYNYSTFEGIGFLTLYFIHSDLRCGCTSMKVYTIAIRDVERVKRVGIVYAVEENIYVYADLGARGVKLYMLGREHVYSANIVAWKASWEHVSGWGRVLLLGNYYVVFGEATSYSLPRIGGRPISCGVGREGLLICYAAPATVGGNYSVNVYALDPINQIILDSEILVFKIKPSCYWHDGGKFLVCIGDSIYLISNTRDGLQTTRYRFDNGVRSGNLLAAYLSPSRKLYLAFMGNKSIVHPKLASTQGLVLAVADERECWITVLWPNSRILVDSVYMGDNTIGVAVLDAGKWEIVVKKLPSSPPRKLVERSLETATLYITVTETVVKASIITVTETRTKTVFTTTTLYHAITRSKTITKTVTLPKTFTTTKTVTWPVTITAVKTRLLTVTETIVPLDAWKTGVGALVAGLLAGYVVARRSCV